MVKSTVLTDSNALSISTFFFFNDPPPPEIYPLPPTRRSPDLCASKSVSSFSPTAWSGRTAHAVIRDCPLHGGAHEHRSVVDPARAAAWAATTSIDLIAVILVEIGSAHV